MPQARLAGIADGFLTHDRPIHMRVDDSVLRVIGRTSFLNGARYFIRRARGYAPDPLLPYRNDCPTSWVRVPSSRIPSA